MYFDAWYMHIDMSASSFHQLARESHNLWNVKDYALRVL